ncbi:MAG: 2Fe-2S iron-sulfur cluster-binding protein [Bacteroidota bacterium]
MMNTKADSVTIKVLYEEEEFELHTYAGEYRNLMMLLYDKIYIHGFGDCKGMGRCATCLVTILGGSCHLPPLERNETETLRKAGYTDPTMRLSCQLQISQGLHNSRWEVESCAY